MRFDLVAIAAGRDGTRLVLAKLGMGPAVAPAPVKTRLSRRSSWVRAPRRGILHLAADLGVRVKKGEPIATIFDASGKRLSRLNAKGGGIVVGHTEYPLVNQGDAVAHIAEL